MKKQLVQAQNVDKFISSENTILVDNSMVLTPGARDVLSSRNIEIIRVSHAQKEEGALSLSSCLPSTHQVVSGETGGELEVFTYNLSAMLEKNCGITDPAKLEAYTTQAIELIKENL